MWLDNIRVNVYEFGVSKVKIIRCGCVHCERTAIRRGKLFMLNHQNHYIHAQENKIPNFL